MGKKLLSYLLAFAIVWVGGCTITDYTPEYNGALSASAFRKDEVYDGVKYAKCTYLDTTEYWVLKCEDKTLTDIIIPSHIDGIPVTRVGDAAFLSCKNLKSLILPETITYIDDSAFMACENLGYLELPSGVQVIGDSAFYECNSLINIVLPRDLIILGDGAFKYCKNLQQVYIPQGVTKLGGLVFYECPNIDTIMGGTGLKDMDKSVMTHRDIYWNDAVTSEDGLRTIGSVVIGYEGTAEELTIPEGITAIAACAFSYNKTVKTITLPSTLRSIGYRAFDDSVLEEVLGSTEHVTYVGDEAFDSTKYKKDHTTNGAFILNGMLCGIEWNVKETDYTLPDSVTSIVTPEVLNNYIENLTIPGSVTSICEKAFKGNSTLKSITFEEGVQIIGDEALKGCKNLTQVNFADSIIHFGNAVFENTAWLDQQMEEKIYLVVNGFLLSVNTTKTGRIAYIPDGVHTIAGKAFDIDYFDTTGLDVSQYWEEVVLPDSVTTIEPYAFHHCPEYIVIPTSVKYIGGYSLGYDETTCDIRTIYYRGTREQWDNIANGVSQLLAYNNSTIEFQSDYLSDGNGGESGTGGYDFSKVPESVGDINGDEEINAADASWMLTYAATLGAGGDGTSIIPDTNYADINLDGDVNAADASMILNYAAGQGAGSVQVGFREWMQQQLTK